MNELQQKLARRRNLNGEGTSKDNSKEASEPPDLSTNSNLLIYSSNQNISGGTLKIADNELKSKLSRRRNLNGEIETENVSNISSESNETNRNLNNFKQEQDMTIASSIILVDKSDSTTIENAIAANDSIDSLINYIDDNNKKDVGSSLLLDETVQNTGIEEYERVSEDISSNDIIENRNVSLRLSEEKPSVEDENVNDSTIADLVTDDPTKEETTINNSQVSNNDNFNNGEVKPADEFELSNDVNSYQTIESNISIPNDEPNKIIDIIDKTENDTIEEELNNIIENSKIIEEKLQDYMNGSELELVVEENLSSQALSEDIAPSDNNDKITPSNKNDIINNNDNYINVDNYKVNNNNDNNNNNNDNNSVNNNNINNGWYPGKYIGLKSTASSTNNTRGRTKSSSDSPNNLPGLSTNATLVDKIKSSFNYVPYNERSSSFSSRVSFSPNTSSEKNKYMDRKVEEIIAENEDLKAKVVELQNEIYELKNALSVYQQQPNNKSTSMLVDVNNGDIPNEVNKPPPSAELTIVDDNEIANLSNARARVKRRLTGLGIFSSYNNDRMAEGMLFDDEVVAPTSSSQLSSTKQLSSKRDINILEDMPDSIASMLGTSPSNNGNFSFIPNENENLIDLYLSENNNNNEINKLLNSNLSLQSQASRTSQRDLLRSTVYTSRSETSSMDGNRANSINKSMMAKLDSHGLFSLTEPDVDSTNIIRKKRVETSQLFDDDNEQGESEQISSPQKLKQQPKEEEMNYQEFLDRFAKCKELTTLTRNFLDSILGPNGDTTPPPKKMKVDYIFYGVDHLEERCRDFFDEMDQLIKKTPEWKNENEDRLHCVRDCLEQYVFSRIWHYAYKIVETPEEDERLLRRMKLLSFLQPDALEIKSEVYDETLLTIARDELKKINNFRTPRDKIACVVKCAATIFRSLSLSRTKLQADGQEEQALAGADDFLPLLIWVVLHSHIPQLFSNCTFIQSYLNPMRLMGKSGYCLINLRSAVEFVIYIEAESIKIDPEEFERKLKEAEDSLG
eukprot:gene6183-8518_t